MASDRPASPDTSPAKPRQDCKTCGSPNRAEIEARLTRGESTRKVAAWLEAERGEAIRYDAIGRHWKAHRGAGAAATEVPPSDPPPASPRVATVTPIRPRDRRQQARQAPQRPASPPGPSAAEAPPATPQAEVVGWKPDLSGLDDLWTELYQTVSTIGRSVRADPEATTFPQATLMVGAARELGKLAQIKALLANGGKAPGQNMTPAAGLKGLLNGAPPPAIEGDEPDGPEDEDELLRPAPRWADAEPTREVVEAPAEEASPPAPDPQPTPTPRATEPAMAGVEQPRRQYIWQPPRR